MPRRAAAAPAWPCRARPWWSAWPPRPARPGRRRTGSARCTGRRSARPAPSARISRLGSDSYGFLGGVARARARRARGATAPAAARAAGGHCLLQRALGQDLDDGAALDLQLDVAAGLDVHVRLTQLRDAADDAAHGDDLVALDEAGDQLLLLLGALLLRPDHEEIHDRDDREKDDELAEAAAVGGGGRRGLGVGGGDQEHGEILRECVAGGRAVPAGGVAPLSKRAVEVELTPGDSSPAQFDQPAILTGGDSPPSGGEALAYPQACAGRGRRRLETGRPAAICQGPRRGALRATHVPRHPAGRRPGA